MSESLKELLNNEDIEGLSKYIGQLTEKNADLKKRVKELNEECEAQQYQFDILKKDPACVWVNMLRGTIATPSALVEAHDYQQIKSENADLRAKLEKALDENNSLKLDYSHSESERVKAEAKCADMRELLVHILEVADLLDYDETFYWTNRIEHILSISCGIGSASPEKVQQLREALNKYGRHIYDCNTHKGCYCGFTKALETGGKK